MPAKQITDETCQTIVQALHANGHNLTAATASLGISRSTGQHHMQTAIARGLYRRVRAAIGSEIAVAAPPAAPDGETIDELIARKKLRMNRSNAHEAWAKLIDVQVKTPGPIGLFFVGDPHVDDDHCDIGQLEHDLSTVGRTHGFYAGHLGDLTNNWVGRLQRLYAHQSVRFDEGLKLTEWMLDLAPNLFVVGGNHDCWEKGMDLLRFITRQGATTGHLQAHGARMALRWPGGQEIRIHARHDFPGKSQFSDTHGMKRELLFGHRDHILVCGHTHVDEARIEPSIDGEVHWLFRVSGYKIVDEYAKEHNFRPKKLAPGVSVVIDPTQSVPAERVKPFWCVERAADYLTFARKKASK